MMKQSSAAVKENSPKKMNRYHDLNNQYENRMPITNDRASEFAEWFHLSHARETRRDTRAPCTMEPIVRLKSSGDQAHSAPRAREPQADALPDPEPCSSLAIKQKSPKNLPSN